MRVRLAALLRDKRRKIAEFSEAVSLIYRLFKQERRRYESALPPSVARSACDGKTARSVRNHRTVCCNDLTEKTREVRAALKTIPEGTLLRSQLDELYRLGAFRHDHDVAFAAIALARGFHTVDSLVDKLSRDYPTDVRCDPVYPPS